MNILRHYSKYIGLFAVMVLLALSFALVQAQDDSAETEEANRNTLDLIAAEGLTQGDAAVLEQWIADDYVVHTPFGDLNRDAVRGFFDAFRAAMTDFNVSRENTVADGNSVATRTVVAGTFDNEYNGPLGVFPPTGEPFTFGINIIFHFNEDGQIQEEWAEFDPAALMAQLAAAVPAAEEAAATEGGISAEAAQAFADRFDAIFDGGNVDIADEIFSPDFVAHLPLAPELDRDAWKAYAASFYEAFPDLTQEINKVIVGPDRVVLYVTYTGTHDGPLFGIPATGNPVTMDGIGIFSFDENGLATENWAVLDVVGVLAQIGAFPPAPAE